MLKLCHDFAADAMISKHLLEQAKAFLCWDAFPDVTIQLVPIQEVLAYYYPPSAETHSIVVFYQPGVQDFSHPLFLLFHEIGHFLQFQTHQRNGTVTDFYAVLQLDNDTKKTAFERDSWERGAIILEMFLKRYHIATTRLLAEYAKYADDCVKSYLSESQSV